MASQIPIPSCQPKLASQKKNQNASAEESGSRLIFLPRLVSICTLVKEISHFCIFHNRVKKKCDSPFNIQWIVAKRGRNSSLLQANDRPKFHTHSSKRGEAISREARSGKEFFYLSYNGKNLTITSKLWSNLRVTKTDPPLNFWNHRTNPPKIKAKNFKKVSVFDLK